MNNREKYKGYRLAGLDYGKKRVGFAVCDELHITVSPRNVFIRDSGEFWDELLAALAQENVKAVIVGVPYRLDEKETEIIREINEFIGKLRERTKTEVIPFDESYSTIRSQQTMLEIGMKRKKRSRKGEKDRIAAALILRDFLQELEG